PDGFRALAFERADQRGNSCRARCTRDPAPSRFGRGKHFGRCLRKLPLEADELTLVCPCRADLMVDAEPRPRRYTGVGFSERRAYSAHHSDELESIYGVISNGRMPPSLYTAVHPEARRSAEQREPVCR